jgi:hypothetical protein
MANVICVFDTTTNTIVSKFIREEYPDQLPLETQIYIPCPSLLIDSVTQDNGNWIFTESQTLLSMYWEKLRIKRNELLRMCDWTQLPDISDLDKQAWVVYRQALRDLPANTQDPANPVWPVVPS